MSKYNILEERNFFCDPKIYKTIESGKTFQRFYSILKYE